MNRPAFMGRTWRIPPARLNLIPLVDLALNLVLILLVTAPSMYLIRLPVKLPEAKTSDIDTKGWVRVTFTAEEKISVNGEIVNSLAALPDRLLMVKDELHQNTFLLEIDRAVPYYKTSRLLEQVRKTVPDARIAIGTIPPHDTSPAH